MNDRSAGAQRVTVDGLAQTLSGLAGLVGGRRFEPHQSDLLVGPPGSVIVDAASDQGESDLVIGLLSTGAPTELFAGTHVILQPDSGPIRYGRLGSRGQLRIRRLAASAFHIELRPAIWLLNRPDVLGGRPSNDLALVVVNGSWPEPPGVALDGALAAAQLPSPDYESADGRVRASLFDDEDGLGLLVTGREGQPDLDRQTVVLRVGEITQGAEELEVELTWDGRRCWGQVQLGGMDAARLNLALPDTLPDPAPHQPPRGTDAIGHQWLLADPADVDDLVLTACDTHQDVDARVGALDLLRAALSRTHGETATPQQLQPLLALLGDDDAVLVAGVLAVVAEGRWSWALPTVAAVIQDETRPHSARAAAVAALRCIGTAGAVESLLQALGDPDARIRAAAAQALSPVGDRHKGS